MGGKFHLTLGKNAREQNYSFLFSLWESKCRRTIKMLDMFLVRGQVHRIRHKFKQRDLNSSIHFLLWFQRLSKERTKLYNEWLAPFHAFFLLLTVSIGLPVLWTGFTFFIIHAKTLLSNIIVIIIIILIYFCFLHCCLSDYLLGHHFVRHGSFLKLLSTMTSLFPMSN